jgi:hypothetical protein
MCVCVCVCVYEFVPGFYCPNHNAPHVRPLGIYSHGACATSCQPKRGLVLALAVLRRLVHSRLWDVLKSQCNLTTEGLLATR